MFEFIEVTHLRSLATVLVFLSFIGMCLWAYSSKNKAKFDEAAQLPFDDTDQNNSH